MELFKKEKKKDKVTLQEPEKLWKLQRLKPWPYTFRVLSYLAIHLC